MGHLKAKKLLGYHQAWLKPRLTPRHPKKNAQVIRWIHRINGDETLKLPLNQNPNNGARTAQTATAPKHDKS